MVSGPKLQKSRTSFKKAWGDPPPRLRDLAKPFSTSVTAIADLPADIPMGYVKPRLIHLHIGDGVFMIKMSL